MTLRQSVAIAVLSDTVHVIVGGVMLVAGILGAMYQIEHPPVVKYVFYPTLGFAVLGALILPTILPTVQKIVVIFFPNGIPLLGGRRSSDPQPPAPPKP